MAFSSFFSSLLPVVHGDAPEEVPTKAEEPQSEPVKEEEPEAEPEKEDEKQDEPAAEPEPEEEEPEDVGRFSSGCVLKVTDGIRQVHPHIREECQQSAKCASFTKHFEHCQEKVHAGKGFKAEDCVEEL
jgi:ubiquinol-cytochrome c reductase subunit 6